MLLSSVMLCILASQVPYARAVKGKPLTLKRKVTTESDYVDVGTLCRCWEIEKKLLLLSEISIPVHTGTRTNI